MNVEPLAPDAGLSHNETRGWSVRGKTRTPSMRKDREIAVTADPTQALAFDVVVRERQGESRHRVTISAADTARYSGSGLDPGGCVEAAMAFLLDREPKESILGAFDISVIRRYFPEFDETFPDYLARFAPGSGSGD